MNILIAAALAAAQAQPSGEIQARPGSEINVPEAEAVRTLHQFASCIVRERTGEARAVLAMDFRSAAYGRRLHELSRSSPRCFRRDYMAMSGFAFAGSLAEQLFLRSYASADPAVLASADLPEARNRSEAMSYCVVRHAPGEARAILDTPVTSEAEGAALAALRPAIAACLDGADEVQLNRLGLRSLVALALYHAAGGRGHD